jgi:hypothetical protein
MRGMRGIEGEAMRRRGVLALGVLVVAAVVGLGALLAHVPSVMALLPDPCPIELYKGWAAPGVHAIGMASHDAGWVVGESGLVFHYHGGTWKHECSPTSRFLSAVAAVSPDDAWAVGDWGTILHYRGGSWTQVASPTQADLRAIAMVAPHEGWAAGGNDDATLLHDAGGTWSLVDVPIPAYLNGIAMVARDDGWAVGAQHPTQPKSAEPGRSVILHYRAGAWTRVASASCPSLSAVAMASPADGWAADDGLLRYSAAGWTSVTTACASPILGVAAHSPGDVWTVSSSSVCHYDGTSWTATALDIPPSGP